MIFLSFSLFYFVLIQLHFQEVTCGGTSTFYYTIKSNDFNTAQDIQFGNSSNPNRRRANYSVAHSVAGPVCSFVTGISLFEMSSSGFLDFTIYKISSTNCTGSTSYSIELAPFVGITSMTYTLFMINSGNFF